MSSETTAAIIATSTTTTATSSTFHHQNYMPPVKHAVMSQQPQAINNQYNIQQPQQHRQPVYLNGGNQYSSNGNGNAYHQYMPYMGHQQQNVQSGGGAVQQHHLQHQQQVIAITPNGAKSMLETLV